MFGILTVSFCKMLLLGEASEGCFPSFCSIFLQLHGNLLLTQSLMVTLKYFSNVYYVPSKIIGARE